MSLILWNNLITWPLVSQINAKPENLAPKLFENPHLLPTQFYAYFEFQIFLKIVIIIFIKEMKYAPHYPINANLFYEDLCKMRDSFKVIMENMIFPDFYNHIRYNTFEIFLFVLIRVAKKGVIKILKMILVFFHILWF